MLKFGVFKKWEMTILGCVGELMQRCDNMASGRVGGGKMWGYPFPAYFRSVSCTCEESVDNYFAKSR